MPLLKAYRTAFSNVDPFDADAEPITVTIELPATFEGDFIFVGAAWVGENTESHLPTLTDPSGWTALTGSNSTFGSVRGYYRQADGSEPASVTFEAPGILEYPAAMAVAIVYGQVEPTLLGTHAFHSNHFGANDFPGADGYDSVDYVAVGIAASYTGSWEDNIDGLTLDEFTNRTFENVPGVFYADAFAASGTDVDASNDDGFGEFGVSTPNMIVTVSGFAVKPVYRPRVRSNVSATVGSLLEATTVSALESQAREAYFEVEDDLPSEDLLPFVETIAPDDVRSRFYRNPVTSEERLDEYAGSTKLGRMADAYPSAVVASAQDAVGRAEMTAQELLDYLFTKWAEEFPWFTYKEVPDLRYRLESGDYSGDGSVDDPGVLTVPAVFYPQDRDEGRRLSMRGIVDDILAIYPGTALMQDAEGDIVLRPTYGPDADASAVKTLALSDAFSMSTGLRPDPRRIYNQARVSFRGGEFQEDQAVTTDVYAMWCHYPEDPEMLDEDDPKAPVNSRERIANEWLGGTIDFDGLVDTGTPITVEYRAELWSAAHDGTQTFLEGTEEGTVAGGDALTLSVGETVTVTVTGKVGEVGWFGGATATGRWEITNTGSGVSVFLAAKSREWGRWSFGYILEFSALGTKYVKSNVSTEAEFGYDLSRDEVPDGSGGNALESNQLAYGEREISHSTTAFPATPTQAQELAQSLVLHHMVPRIVRTVEQSWSSKYGILPDHIGRLVELPTTETALVEERTYTDDYTNVQAPALASTFKATVVGDPIGLPDQDGNTTQEDPPTGTPNDDGILAFDSGAWLRFDSGVLVKET